MVVDSAPMDGVGLVSCDVFLVSGTCACVLVDGAGSLLSEGQCSVQESVLEYLWVQYAFRQSF